MEGQIVFFGDEFLHCYLHPRKRIFYLKCMDLLPKSCPKKLKEILVFEEMLSLFGYLLSLWAIC
jgi:hypothetical protein